MSWIVSGVVVLVVGVLVVRTLQRDTATRAADVSRKPARAAGSSSPEHQAPRPAGSDTTKSGSLEGKMSSVEKAKIVLKERGFYDGPINGNYDPPMIESLKRFQAASGMKPTGYLDMKTYSALGIEFRRGS